MAGRADCGSVHLACREGRVSTAEEQKADCGIWRQRWDLGGLICCSDMIRLKRGGRKSRLGRSHIHSRKHTPREK